MSGANKVLAWVEVCVTTARTVPPSLWALLVFATLFTLAAVLYSVVFAAAPVPRAPVFSEKLYRTISSDGQITEPVPLPCWIDSYPAGNRLAERTSRVNDSNDIEEAEVFISVVIPAYNEEDRITAMLDEAVDYLEQVYKEDKSYAQNKPPRKIRQRNVHHEKSLPGSLNNNKSGSRLQGYEILVVSDGSSDKTVPVVLNFARQRSAESIRVIELVSNRGKGGAVTHGMRHTRGEYIVFADADGASKFSDLEKLVKACQDVKDDLGRSVAVGSRAHLVGSDAVVKRSPLRNFLMHSFHILLRVLTPPATSKIKDTQCGFKLFSRQSLPYIIPHMHSEGWIFDVEMLMLAESAKIPMIEVPIGWKEVKGSKLNVLWDSLGMAWGLAILRLAWAFGVYRV